MRKKIVHKRAFEFPYLDRVYGSFGKKDFDDFALGLIKTAVFNRLGHIYQHGPDIFWDPALDGTRAEHSIGVYLLLKHLKAPVDEQVAGLLHDLSHTAFSHAADFLDNDHSDHQYAERHSLRFLQKEEILTVLSKFNLSGKDVDKNPSHLLLERAIPDLCADRVDNLYRDACMKGMINSSEARENLKQLTVWEEEIIFKEKSAAKFFGETYLAANEKIFYSPRSVFTHQVLADAIRIGLKKGLLSEDDFFSTDEKIWQLLSMSADEEVISGIHLVANPPNLDIAENDGEGRKHFRSKVRYVDPKFFQNGKPVRLSEVDREYSRKIKKAIKWQERGFFIKIG